MRRLDGRTAVVTGGAGGIGRGVCERLAEAGASVVVGYAGRAERAEALAAALPGPGAHAAAQVRVDDPASVAAFADGLTSRTDAVHVLVNNAGITKPVPHTDLDGLDDELIDHIFRVNWRGSFAMIRALRPLLERAGAATVVNISSVAAVTGLGSNVAYCASKAALDSMTRSLARALAPAIRVVSVSPGWVEGEYASSMPRAVIDEQLARTPLGRLATPDDVGDAVYAAVALLTDTTGVALAVDGGRPLGA